MLRLTSRLVPWDSESLLTIGGVLVSVGVWFFKVLNYQLHACLHMVLAFSVVDGTFCYASDFQFCFEVDP